MTGQAPPALTAGTLTAGTLTIGMLLFPNMTQLDLTGPYEVFARLPRTRVVLIAKTLDPVASDRGLAILPTARLDDCPPLDIICVPGGPGQMALMHDAEVLGFLRRRAPAARYVTSVCTGSLVLGAAGDAMDGVTALTVALSVLIALLVIAPLVILFLFFQRRFIESFASSGLK